MKLFSVRPLVVKPFVVDPSARHWWWFISAGLSYFIGVWLILGSLVANLFGVREAVVGFLLGIPAIWLGNGLVAIGRFVRDTQQHQAEMAKRLTEQDEHIRKLEAQVAALTSPSPTP